MTLGTYSSVVYIGMSFGISVNDLPEQSTTVPSHEQFDGHGTSEKQSPAPLDFIIISSRPVGGNVTIYL